MNYKLVVSRYDYSYFHVDNSSISSREGAHKMYAHFAELFLPEDGFEVVLTEWATPDVKVEVVRESRVHPNDK